VPRRLFGRRVPLRDRVRQGGSDAGWCEDRHRDACGDSRVLIAGGAIAPDSVDITFFIVVAYAAKYPGAPRGPRRTWVLLAGIAIASAMASGRVRVPPVKNTAALSRTPTGETITLIEGC